MQYTTGTVVNGKIEVEGAVLPEGAVVAVISRSESETFSLTPEQEDEILAADAEIDRGEYLSLNELLASLKSAR